MEIKPGKWRLKDGREVVVLRVEDGRARVADGYLVARHAWEGAEYLGPAVIGEPVPDVERNYWVKRANEAEQQCRELEAETVATRELLEQAEKRCEELATDLEDSDEAFRLRTQRMVKSGWHYEVPDTETTPYNSRAHEAETKLASAQCVIEGLEERVRFLEEYLQEKLAGMPEVADEDGVKVLRFKSVTVMVRGEHEATCHPHNPGRWTARQVGDPPYVVVKTRELAEAWCREQLAPECSEQSEPRWREATEGDIGKPCRTKDHLCDNEWQPHDRLLGVIDHEFRFVVAVGPNTHTPIGYRYCEVQDDG